MDSKLRSFFFSCMGTGADLDRYEERTGVNIVQREDVKEAKLADNFEAKIYNDAKQMSEHYITFYCLERSARNIVVGKLKATHGGNWWTTKVPSNIQSNVAHNMQRELDAGVAPRSEDEIDYTNFGELGEIVKANWADFGDMFKSVKAFTKIMANLNVLRGPIAHCSILSEDEILRLQLTVKDWIRLLSK
ncbi:hypothetical protein JXA32_00010 [Candidatus Sumerlaeota bacterium]|nr:hypothetical protein [Candidatus Sumerlaeota bacterium]